MLGTKAPDKADNPAMASFDSCGRETSVARPDYTAPLLIEDLGMGKEDGVFEILQVVILHGKLALQGAIGDAAMLV